MKPWAETKGVTRRAASASDVEGEKSMMSNRYCKSYRSLSGMSYDVVEDGRVDQRRWKEVNVVECEWREWTRTASKEASWSDLRLSFCSLKGTLYIQEKM